MSNALKSGRSSRSTQKSARVASREQTGAPERDRLKGPRRPRLAVASAEAAPDPGERRRGPREAPGFASRKGQKLVGGLTKAEIVQKYSDMVRIAALKLAKSLPQSVDKDDLISTGYIGLMDAADKFDSRRGVKFETYAEFRVKGAMLDELRKQDWVPRSVRNQVKALEKASQAVVAKKGRLATDREVSRKLGMTLENYYQIKTEIGALTLLTFEQAGAFQDSDALSLEDTLENSRTPDPFTEVSRKDAQDLLNRLSENLTDQERTVVSCYYIRGLNLKEISMILGLTESRICQLHGGAIRKLKEQLRSEVSSPKNLFLMLLNEP